MRGWDTELEGRDESLEEAFEMGGVNDAAPASMTLTGANFVESPAEEAESADGRPASADGLERNGA